MAERVSARVSARVSERARRFLVGEAARVRHGGREAMLWSLRVTLAATASYVVGLLIFPGTEPLLAPLTAMLVTQVTPVSLLASGLDRVVSVVAGVALAVGFAAVVPLEWWSLGLLLLVATTVGQFLRLRNNLFEVGISAMLVLGVGAYGAPAAAWQRITETLVGAGVAILANLLFPTKVVGSSAGHAIDDVANALSDLLTRIAGELDEIGTDEGLDRLPTLGHVWLDDVRRITRRIPEVDAALQAVEEGRRFNLRSVGRARVEPGLRQGLEALEHTGLAVRSLVRSMADIADGRWPAQPGGHDALTGLAETCRQMAAGIDAFGELVRNEGDVQVELTRGDVVRLRGTLDDLRGSLARLDRAVVSGASPDVIELHAVERTTVRRLVRELDLEARVRRQLGLPQPRRVPRPARRRERPDLWEPTDPDAPTMKLPRIEGPGEPRGRRT